MLKHNGTQKDKKIVDALVIKSINSINALRLYDNIANDFFKLANDTYCVKSVRIRSFSSPYFTTLCIFPYSV